MFNSDGIGRYSLSFFVKENGISHHFLCAIFVCTDIIPSKHTEKKKTRNGFEKVNYLALGLNQLETPQIILVRFQHLKYT